MVIRHRSGNQRRYEKKSRGYKREKRPTFAALVELVARFMSRVYTWSKDSSFSIVNKAPGGIVIREEK